MRKYLRGLCASVAMLAFATSAQAQNNAASLDVCVAAISSDRSATRYRVSITWNDPSISYDRIDIGVEDSAGAIWPQLRDQRLRPRARPTVIPNITEGGSQYPLTFFLIGMSAEAVTAFDADCGAGFCHLNPTQPGVTRLSGPVVVGSQFSYARCRDQQ